MVRRLHARNRRLAAIACLGLGLWLGGCTSDDGTDGRSANSPSPSQAESEQRYPDVVDATAEHDGSDTFSFHVTISSPYDTPERYADGWRIIGPDGAVYGEHSLAHDHASEQPFTRTQSGVRIPADVDEVTVEARDQQYGYGGETITLTIER
jgi:hypothetical protein